MRNALLLASALSIAACGDANESRNSAPEPPARPAALPTEAEISAACFPTPEEMADEQARQGANGVIIDPTFDEYVVRNVRCSWRSQQPAVAACRFEHATVPMGSQIEPERSRHLEWLSRRRWQPSTAVLAFGAEGWSARDGCPDDRQPG